MKKSIDHALDDHPAGGECPQAAWVVAIADDCDDCQDIRVEMTVEELGHGGARVIAHMRPGTARRLRAALAAALHQLGEPVAQQE
ncbi:MAG: hypothetical protein M3256_11775 [Actinomycetota bacterium]|nr:hypothetical protein [Actinomycetota bacterium]MDQ6946917.1 hypothetical protein [Actinomycetota bacterium]